jgi:hypothetical protein
MQAAPSAPTLRKNPAGANWRGEEFRERCR